MAAKKKKKRNDEVGKQSFSSHNAATTIATVLFSLLVRVLVPLGPYSGEGRPPMYGDYEAQRHWMEVALHLPAKEWYRNSHLQRPLLLGARLPSPHRLPIPAPLPPPQLLAPRLPPPLRVPGLRVPRLQADDEVDRHLLRSAYFLSGHSLFRPLPPPPLSLGRGDGDNWLLAVILLNPCQILIDHGHFQYNCISLGFTLGAIAAVLSANELVAALLFTLAINHKQCSKWRLRRPLRRQAVSFRIAFAVDGGVGGQRRFSDEYVLCASIFQPSFGEVPKA